MTCDLFVGGVMKGQSSDGLAFFIGLEMENPQPVF